MDPIILDLGAIDRAIDGDDRMLTVSIPKEAIMVIVGERCANIVF
jgi:hypothetical protein